jgi:hypothetical protein
VDRAEIEEAVRIGIVLVGANLVLLVVLYLVLRPRA